MSVVPPRAARIFYDIYKATKIGRSFLKNLLISLPASSSLNAFIPVKDNNSKNIEAPIESLGDLPSHFERTSSASI